MNEKILKLKRLGKPELQFTYEQENLVKVQNSQNQIWRYSYDPLHNLKNFQNARGVSYQIEYDVTKDRALSFKRNAKPSSSLDLELRQGALNEQ